MSGVERYADQEQLSIQPESLTRFHQVETVARRAGYLYEMIPLVYQKLAEPILKKTQTLLAT